MSPFRILEHLDLVDHNRSDIADRHTLSEKIVHTLVGSNNNTAACPTVSNRTRLRQIHPGNTGHYGCLGYGLVFFRETVILLVRKSDKRDQEKHSPAFFEIIFQPRHLSDEGLAARRRGDNEQIFSIQKTRLDSTLLGGHQGLDTAEINKFPWQRQIFDPFSRRLIVGLEPVEHRFLGIERLRLKNREHHIQITILFQKIFDMELGPFPEMFNMAKLAAELALCTVETDILLSASDPRLFGKRGYTIVKQTGPAKDRCLPG